MGIKINLTADEVKAAKAGFQPIAAGIYTASIYENKLKKSHAGNPMFEVTFKLIDGPEVRKNMKLKFWAVLQPNALFSINALNKAVGFPTPSLEDVDKDGNLEFEFEDPESYLGLEVNIKVIVEDYDTVDDDDKPVVAQRNSVKTVYKFDPDKITGGEDSAPSTFQL